MKIPETYKLGTYALLLRINPLLDIKDIPNPNNI